MSVVPNGSCDTSSQRLRLGGKFFEGTSLKLEEFSHGVLIRRGMVDVPNTKEKIMTGSSTPGPTPFVPRDLCPKFFRE